MVKSAFQFRKQLADQDDTTPEQAIPELMDQLHEPQAVIHTLRERGYDISQELIYYYLQSLGYKKKWVRSDD